MKTRLLLAMVLFLSLGLGTSLAAPSLPDNVSITPPDSSVPSEIIKFFGNSGRWDGIWSFIPKANSSGQNLNVTIIVEELKENEAKGIFSVEGSRSGIREGWQRFVAKIYPKRKRILLSFVLPTASDSDAKAEFWVKDGVLKGERYGQTGFGNPFVSTFKLNPQ